MKAIRGLYLCLVLACAGCAMMGGDMPIRVSGTIPPSSQGVNRHNCSLGLALSDANRIRSRREISPEFLTSFVIEARAKRYQFIARCEDSWESHSASFELGGRGSFNTLVELGTLHD